MSRTGDRLWFRKSEKGAHAASLYPKVPERTCRPGNDSLRSVRGARVPRMDQRRN